MADVGAIVAGPRQPDLRVQVGAIEIDLPAMAVNDVADFANMLLEHAVGRGIGDHDGGEVSACCSAFARKSATSTLPLRVARRPPRPPCRPYGPTPDWCRAPRTGSGRPCDAPRRALRDSRGSPAARHIRPARRNSAAARRVIAGDVAQPFLQIARTARDSRPPARRGANGCRSPNSGQVIGIISEVGVELHGAGAERNHRAVEREIAVARARACSAAVRSRSGGRETPDG